MMHLAHSRRRVLIESDALALIQLPAELLFAEPVTSDLKDITGNAVPISVAERQGRIECARRLMHEDEIKAILIEPARAWFTLPG